MFIWIRNFLSKGGEGVVVPRSSRSEGAATTMLPTAEAMASGPVRSVSRSEAVMTDSIYKLAEVEDGIRVLELSLPFSLDVITFDDLNAALTAELGDSPVDYVVDLTGTEYVGSAVLGLLVNIRSRIRRSGGRLVLCKLSPRIVEIFRIGSLESLFTITPTREAALVTLRA